jgi:hypothetical protein
MLTSLIDYCRQNARVCPLPDKWIELWEMLPDKERVGNGRQPPLPLILAAWRYTGAREKMARLKEHLDYAGKHKVLEQVDSHLRGLQESEWAHSGER